MITILLQEFIIKVYKPLADKTWIINKRYTDFHKLHNVLHTSGISLEFPPKKFIGNMDPHFIGERQQGLQVCGFIIRGTSFIETF